MLKPNSFTHKLEMVTTEYGLVQMVEGPTRVTQTTATQNDLFYTTTDPGVILSHGRREVGLSDHSLIFAMLMMVMRSLMSVLGLSAAP